jgi:hypothetical protein
VDETGSGSCSTAAFRISGVEPRVLLLESHLISKKDLWKGDSKELPYAVFLRYPSCAFEQTCPRHGNTTVAPTMQQAPGRSICHDATIRPAKMRSVADLTENRLLHAGAT